MKTKTFDCVQMKRKGAKRIYEQVRDMPLKQELAFWRQKTAELLEKKCGIKRKRVANKNPASGRRVPR